MNSETRHSNYLKMRTWIDNKSKQNRELYYQNSKKCKKCHSVIPFEFKKNIFCSSICSGSTSKGRHHSSETRLKISKSIRENLSITRIIKPKEWFSVCCVCNSIMRNSFRITCSDTCHHISMLKAGRTAGLKSASKRVLRSKNEIQLFDLLSNHYSCIHNQSIFNGWDADIIISDLKLAILWNGIWHYEKVCNSHSLEQVQNRDSIKIKEIQKFGYNYLIIKDHNNQMTSEKAFIKIQECIYNKQFNIEIY